ncbi:carbon storage regulator CsrA [Caldisalinibacter kiritimatiensis]|uniref:Translational regulator CsrA n=1 Tax=Caldisalinibacter kiritimatiensis TaxID=1304284 RepID=R1AUQ5_9FIRM|nr:carbon storage regulator CsrA [Caldisalinibacter kiritimatiensis]EOD00372.1 Carbon storage regulator [Caldisalinibacter kiritimatiensis]
MLILARKKEESIMIGDNIEIVVVDIDEGKVKLGIKAPKDIDVHRKEIYEEIQISNKEAANTNKIDFDALKNIFRK